MSAWRVAAGIALVVLSVLAVATLREIHVGEAEVAAADAAAQRSDWGDAVSHARAAAEAFAPGSPWPSRGWARLEALGHDAEARGDDATALLAYGAMRSAALATRGLGTGADAWRSRAEEGIARVTASAKTDTAPRAAQQPLLDALRGREPPPTGRLALLAAAGLAMLGGMARLAWASAPRSERIAQGVAVAGLLAYALAFFA
jgi:hypothetical protein